MKANFQNFAALFLLSFLLSNCQTVKKYVESGNYDDAIDLVSANSEENKRNKPNMFRALKLPLKSPGP